MKPSASISLNTSSGLTCSLPLPFLSAISHNEATLTWSVLPASAIRPCAIFGKRGSSDSHQRRICVSSRRFMTSQFGGKIGASCHDDSSPALMGSSKFSAIQILPLSAPGARFFCAGFSSGASRAIGFPALAIITSSPAATRSSKRERWVLASWILTVCIILGSQGN